MTQSLLSVAAGLPRETGVHWESTPTLAEARRLPLIERIEQIPGLNDIQAEMVFLAPALLPLAGFDAGVVSDWMLTRDCAGEVFFLTYPRPLFQLPPLLMPLAATLWCCSREIWDQVGLGVYLHSLTSVDRVRRAYARCFLHQIRMPDPKRPLDWVTVASIGVTSTLGLFWIESGPTPFLRYAPPEAETLREAQAVLTH